MSIRKSGLVLAGAAAALLASGFAPTTFAADAEVKCVGGNACKGKSECKGKNLKGNENKCKGANSCRAAGWVKMSSEQCAKIEGAKAEAITEEKK
jgi:hypothetical protein